MSAVGRVVVGQFKRPSGLLGRLAGAIMARRPSNVARNQWTVQLVDPRPGNAVLEIGCGPGLALLAAAWRVNGCGTVVGLDHSPLMLRQARARLVRAGLDDRIALEEGGIDRLAEWPERFDRILSVNVVQFLPDLRQAFGLMRAALRHNGVVAATYQPRHRAPTREDALAKADQIAAALREAGFADVRTELLELKPVPAVCVLGRKP